MFLRLVASYDQLTIDDSFLYHGNLTTPISTVGPHDFVEPQLEVPDDNGYGSTVEAVVVEENRRSCTFFIHYHVLEDVCGNSVAVLRELDLSRLACKFKNVMGIF